MGFFAFFKNVFFPPPVVVDPIPKEFYERTPGYVEFKKGINPSDLAGINRQQVARNLAFEEFAWAVEDCLDYIPECRLFDLDIRKAVDNVNYTQPNYGDYLFYLKDSEKPYLGFLTHYHMDQFVPAEAAKQIVSNAKWEAGE